MRALVTFLPVTHYLEVTIRAAESRRRPLKLRLCHPGSGEWHQAMDGLDQQGGRLGHRGMQVRRASFGEIVAHIPGQLLPPPPWKVTVTFERLAEGPSDLFNADERAAMSAVIAMGPDRG